MRRRRERRQRCAPNRGSRDCPAETLRLAASLGVRDSTALRIAKRQMCAKMVAEERHLGLVELELRSAYYGSKSDGFDGLAAGREARSPVFVRETGGCQKRTEQESQIGGEVHGFSPK